MFLIMDIQNNSSSVFSVCGLFDFQLSSNFLEISVIFTDLFFLSVKAVRDTN